MSKEFPLCHHKAARNDQKVSQKPPKFAPWLRAFNQPHPPPLFSSPDNRPLSIVKRFNGKMVECLNDNVNLFQFIFNSYVR